MKRFQVYQGVEQMDKSFVDNKREGIYQLSKSPCISLMTMICLVLNWLRLQLALK